MVRVGIAGIGFMGMMHYLAYGQAVGIEVTAICSRSEKKLAGDWRDIKGNFGPRGVEMDLSHLNRHWEIEQLLADDTVDVVDICLPPDLHLDVARRAFAAGKHVFCEKPMALNAEDCDQMVAASQEAQRQLLIGHVLPFFPEYQFAYQAMLGGDYGKLLGGTFKRVISDPTWIADFYDPGKVGGPLIDLHVHDAHFIRLLFGMPTGLYSRGRMRGEVVEYCHTQFAFRDPDVVVSAVSGVIHQQGRTFTHGFEIHFERATLQYESAVINDDAELLMPLTVYTAAGEAVRPDIVESDAFIAEVQEVEVSIESGRPSRLLGGEFARDAIVLCQRQTESVREGRPLQVE